MKELLKREIRRDGYDILRSAGLMLIIPFVLIILQILFADKMHQLCEVVCTLPEPAGLLFRPKNTIFMTDYAVLLSVVIMICNFVIVWNACQNTVYIMNADEENGTIFYMCNQMYAKRDFARAKYVYSVMHFALTYGIWYVGMIVFAMVSNIAVEKPLLTGVVDMFGDMLMGVLVGILFVSLTFLYVVWTEIREDESYSFYIGAILVGTVVLANFSKVVDIIVWIMDNRGVGVAGLEAAAGKLEMFKVISPLSWINPFVKMTAVSVITYVAVVVVMSVASYVIGVKRYEKRNLIY